MDLRRRGPAPRSVTVGVTSAAAGGPVVLIAPPPTSGIPGATTRPGPTTTGPGAVITINGGPSATAHIVGAQTDATDFFGLGVAVVVIVGAIFLTRLVFRRRRGEPPAEGRR